jgi:UDP-N-acetylglucosamine 2-epimerase
MQKEAFFAKKQTLTIRNETEWPETTDSGWNVLDFELQNAAKLVNRPTPLNQTNFFGDGQASLKIHDSIVHFLSTKR